MRAIVPQSDIYPPADQRRGLSGEHDIQPTMKPIATAASSQGQKACTRYVILSSSHAS